MNDQQGRARLCAELAALGGVRAVVETGTYRGTTTLFLARQFRCPVVSLELDPRFHHYARWRTRGERDVRLVLGDSRALLGELRGVPRSDVFFYLDAHRPGNDPLRDELEAIRRGFGDSIIMIDDFAVPGDPGYRHNEGLDERLLPPELARFYPATPSREETGYQRGCVVLAMPGPWVARLAGLSRLRSG